MTHRTLWVPNLEVLRCLPRVQRLLARGNWRPEPVFSAAHALFRLFGVTTARLPWAAATHAFDAGEAGGCWLRSDPVHLMLGTSQAVLAPTSTLDLSVAEVRSLGASLAPVFEAHGMALEQLAANRWYLRLPDDAELELPPPIPGSQARLPSSIPPWGLLLTEAQMVLFADPVNEVRVAEGRDVINSLWFWGAGSLPPLKRLWSLVRTEDPVVAGLALASGARLGLPGDGGEANESELWVPAGLFEPAEAVAALDAHWLQPLEDQVREGTCETWHIRDHHGVLTLDARALKRWWRLRHGYHL